MTLQRRPARRITVIISETDTCEHRPLATEIVHRAHAAGLPGASVFRGIEGYGTTGHIHTMRILSLSDELPIAVVIIGDPDAIDDFVPEIAPLLKKGGVLTVDDVEVVEIVRGHLAEPGLVG
jgi:PII-like signaling protein